MSLLEVDLFEEGAAEPHHRGALDLVREVVGIDDRAAVESGDEARHVQLAVGRDADLGAGRDAGVLLDAAGDPEPGAVQRRLLAPARPVGSGSEHLGEPLVLEVAQP